MHNDNHSYIVPIMPDISQIGKSINVMQRALEDARIRVRRTPLNSTYVHFQILGGAGNRTYGHSLDFPNYTPIFAALQALSQSNAGPTLMSLSTNGSSEYMQVYVNPININSTEKALEVIVLLTEEQAETIATNHPILSGFLKSIYPVTDGGDVYDYAFFVHAYDLPFGVVQIF